MKRLHGSFRSTVAASIAVVLTMAISTPSFAVPKLIPVVSAQLSTGQWYFQGQKSALGGNLGLLVVPAVRYTNRFSIIPTFESSYRGTRSAEELAGGSTLFQDTWENAVGIKLVHGLSEHWRIKERAGMRMKWFRETRDESWNNGLYDYKTYSVGTEAEYQWNKETGLAGGYDFSLLRFPNYSSLESATSSDLSREFVGTHVLDAQIQMYSLRGYAPIGLGITSQLHTVFSPRNYRDQTVVQVTGLLSSEKRHDVYTGTDLALERPFRLGDGVGLIANVSGGMSKMNSNQNHYDARLTTFIADYYDYDQKRLGTNLTLAFGRTSAGPMTLQTGYNISRRTYSNRPIQSSDGLYLSDKLYVNETALTLSFSYPLSRNFRLQTSSTFGRSKSNNDYEAVYRYNYSNSNYQFGFTYDY